MRNSNLLLLAILLISINSFSQKVNSFDLVIMTKLGDINNDKILDSAVVKQDTINEFKPYRLEIYFGTKTSYKKLILKTDNTINPELPNGKNGYRTGNGFWEIKIENHSLLIKNELLRCHFEHKFQYQNDNFELTEYNYVESDGRGRIYFENYDLLTGIRKTKTESYQDDKIIEQNQEVIKLDPLPNLADFHPREQELF